MIMKKYNESISDSSVWLTATPTPLAKTLPFFISEAGHFMAEDDYTVKRNTHDSFLLLYTLNGDGAVSANGCTDIRLPKGCCVVIDCHMPHEYHSLSDKWEFIWIHFGGCAATPFFKILYPDEKLHAVYIDMIGKFEGKLSRLLEFTEKNDVMGSMEISSNMHSLLNSVCICALENEKNVSRHESADDINAVVAFIENNYQDAVTLDDMTDSIHASKYHFIRRFKREMGITPYSYLTSYRINISKTLLRTTNKSVAEIAELCGFLDTGNFISHFKKHTGQKPLQYRKDFSSGT